MNVDTKIFLGRKFKEYYMRNHVPAPMDIGQREFGFGTLEEKIKFRHKSFKSEKELQNYLQRETPFYISYSAAYYDFPENREMKEKNWNGADLVFDLDAPMPFMDERILGEVKGQMINLLEFLLDDFGLDKNKMKINFSGSKGYHIHSWDEKVLNLSGDERREIVDYVTATGLDRRYFLHESDVQEGIVFSKSGRRDAKIQSKMLVGPKADSTGWALRIYKGVLEYIENSSKIGDEDKVKLKKSIEAGVWSGIEGFREKSFDKIVEKYAIKLTGDTDKMVTLDTARLIRLPDSLHGGTGLRAAIVKDVDKFDPSIDAIAFNESEVKISMAKDAGKFKLKGREFGPYSTGENLGLPEYAAIYLMLKEYGEILK